MSRVAGPLLLLALLGPGAGAADLPPGAVARLGDPSFRAGSRIDHLVLSPDGTQYATVRHVRCGIQALTTWDAATGRPVRESQVNTDLFQGAVWGPDGAVAVVVRAEPGVKDEFGQLFPDEFRAWNFTDPRAVSPPVLPVSPPVLACNFGNGRVCAIPPEGTSRYYTAVEFSGDGKRAAAGCASTAGKYAVHVFDLKPPEASGRLARVANLDLGAERPDAVRISGDGKTVVTFRRLASADAHADHFAATVWDTATGKAARPVQVQTCPASRTDLNPRLMLAPDGHRLVLCAAEAEEWGFDLFDLETYQRRKLVRWKSAPANVGDGEPVDRGRFAFAPDGHTLAVAAAGKTFLIDLQAGRELGNFEGHVGTPTAIAFSADGSTLATADSHGLVRLWDPKTRRARNDASGHRAPVRYAELSPDGKRLLTWAEDETVRVWDVGTGQELRAFAGALGTYGSYPNVEVAGATFTPDGTAIFYRTSKGFVARDLLSGLEVPLPGDMKDLEARFAVFAPDGKAVLTWSRPQTGTWAALEVWDWPSGKKRFAAADVTGEALSAPGFSPDGTVVYMSRRSPYLLDARNGKKLPRVWDDRKRSVHPLLALRPNPCYLFYAGDKCPQVIESGTGTPVTRYRLNADPRNADLCLEVLPGVAVSPAGGQFAQSPPRYSWGGYPDGPQLVQLGEAATGSVRRELSGQRGEVRVLGFTPDGSKLLTAGGDHTVLVWDMRLQAVPLPDALKQETNAAKLWDRLAAGDAKDAYLAMARLSREPGAAVKMAKLRLKPAAKGEPETDAGRVADTRGVELLESLGTGEARALLKELAGGHPAAFRTHEAKRTLEPLEKTGYNAK